MANRGEWGGISADRKPDAVRLAERATDLPSWATDAVWYQIFVSRFRNGDPSNDPPGTLPWTTDWLGPRPDGHRPERVDLYGAPYGGDLAGVRDRLDYIRSLGVNTIYLNPIFAAGSQHKYDTHDLRHVDDSFGVAGASARLSGETADPATWQWSDSDRLFLDLIREAHAKGLRIVIDGVFNHVGTGFWAFEDVMRNGRESPYADWFAITDFGPPLQWQAWNGPNASLPEFKRTEDGLVQPVEDHLFAIVRRWMDPNGDGDPSDGVDGWRLDAPQHVPHGFWRRFRTVVKDVNPDAIILGELWFDDLSEWFTGDQYDNATNYYLADAVTAFCRPESSWYPATRFARDIKRFYRDLGDARSRAMVSLLDSHDCDRVLSMMANPRRRFDTDNLPGEGSPPYAEKPAGQEAYDRARLAAALQFTLPGAPMIYNGDEVGMWGGEDPYCRAPMWWTDLGATESCGYRAEWPAFYRGLAALREQYPALRWGNFRMVLADDARRVVAFERSVPGVPGKLVIVANGSTREQTIRLTIGEPGGDARSWSVAQTPEPGAGPPACPELDAGGGLDVACRALDVVVVRVER